MAAAMAKEIHLRASYLAHSELDSIYLGGGTPSILSPEELSLLFDALASHFTWTKASEITLEANPDDINTQSLANWKRLGINRLSIGLQSFNDAELQWMNRPHTASQSEASVKLAQDAGFYNLSLDLIYGSRFQNSEDWDKTLQKVVDLQPTHISAYNLTIEEKTRLGVLKKRGVEPAVNDEQSSRQFASMRTTLQKAGFEQYEISNFAKPGFYAKHNSAYWLQQPYLGIGPSAHSFNGTSRQWNVANNSQYTKLVNANQPFFETETLKPNERFNEYVLTRLRTTWGCDLNEINRLFGEDAKKHFEKHVLKQRSFFEQANGVYRLNEQGLLFADGIASAFFLL